MKKVIFCLTITVAFACASLAGEGKDCAASCADKATKVAKASECSKTAKAAECSKSASSCCASKKANATAKGATQLLARR